ncbi:MAG: fibronectin type III domain-containing protein [Lachnospiraceae bacterium]|nr:fibronectin type III domain-containing protein [Lachnospiraceae bacterium]
MNKKKIISILTAAAIIGSAMSAQTAFASTDHYNDSSVTGGDAWSEWESEWETIATDYTKVSLTPGADETELNFAWYSENIGSDATPVVHFGTDADALEEFTGTSGDVNTDLTGGVEYHYNHVTVTGLEPETTY